MNKNKKINKFSYVIDNNANLFKYLKVIFLFFLTPFKVFKSIERNVCNTKGDKIAKVRTSRAVKWCRFMKKK